MPDRACPLTIGSLFSGIGGLELGLERAGLGPVLWQVEIDPYCRAVLEKHWPGVRRYEDVRLVRGADLAPVDIICGGFPCQGISSAGNQLGLEDPRSGLWAEYARVVGEVRPRFVVVENSPFLAGNGLERVLADLAALGMDAIWFPVSCADVGGPHLRERLFVVAHADAVRELQPEGGESNVGRRHRGGACAGRDAPHADAARFAQHQGGATQEAPTERGAAVGLAHGGTARPSHWRAEPDVVRVVHGVPSRVDRVGALGNAVVPQVAEVVGHVVRAIHEGVR